MIMKKNLVALGVAAVLASTAGGAMAANSIRGTGGAGAGLTNTAATALALAVTPTGIGHILFVPYYNAVGGNATLLNLTNTDATNGKAVKVRFRGATNSDDVFDFTVLMSPGDVWTAKVARGSDGKAVLTTGDNSVTLPAIPAAGQAFVTDRLPPTFTAEQKAAQTLEGYIEILNVANVPPKFNPAAVVAGATLTIGAVATGGGTDNPLFTAIKHVNGVAPGTTTVNGAAYINNLKNALTDEASAVNAGFDAPTGGLFANWTVIDLANASVAWSGEATAVQATGGTGAGRIVFSPQLDGAVDFNKATKLTADPLLRYSSSAAIGAQFTAANIVDPAVIPQYFDFPDLSTPYVGGAASDTSAALTYGAPIAQANELGFALAVSSIKNEYLTDTSISAFTDWTFSMPTRRYGVAVKYSSATPNFTRVLNTVAATTAAEPITTAVAPGTLNSDSSSLFFTATNTELSAHKILTSTGDPAPLTFRDREERSVSTGFVFSPATASSLKFNGEVSVLSFNAGGDATASVLAGSITRQDVTSSYKDGWANINIPGVTGTATAPAVGGAWTAIQHGLPIVGHAFTRATGPAVAGKSTNFGQTFRHRYTAAATR